MRLCIQGVFQNIIVDDYIPYNKPRGVPAFSKAKGPELWVMLLEKAWAKVNGSYEDTITGIVSEGFRVLTGAPCDYYNHDYVEELWDTILKADQNNYIICASAGRAQISKQEYEEVGLVSDHAYAVIEAHEVDTADGRARLLRLRNPWGHKEWCGAWSDNSDKWTPELRRMLNVKEADDGEFFIAHEDYMNYFRSTVICKIHDGFVHESIAAGHALGKHSLIKIELRTATRVFFTVSQMSTRLIPRGHKYEISFVKMMLAFVDPEDEQFPLRYVDGRCWKDEDVTLDTECALEPGEYIMFVEVDWADEGSYSTFNFNTYSDEKVSLELLDAEHLSNFLPDILMSCARQKTQRKNYADKGKEGKQMFRCLSITDSKAEYGFIYYENNSQEASLCEHVLFNKLENFVFLPPHEGQRVIVEVGPGESKIVIMKRTDRSASYSCTYYSSMVYSESKLLQRLPSQGKKVQIKY